MVDVNLLAHWGSPKPTAARTDCSLGCPWQVRAWRRAVLLSLLLTLTTVATGCGGPLSKIPQYSMPVPSPHHGFANRIGTKIAEASAMRGWSTKPAGRNAMVATYVHGRLMLAVTIQWDAKTHWLTYRDSQGLRYNARRNGLHPRGVQWMKNLERTIDHHLAKP